MGGGIWVNYCKPSPISLSSCMEAVCGKKEVNKFVR